MIRQATLADFDAIVYIRESVALDAGRLEDTAYRVEMQRSGFLLPSGLRKQDFRADLPDYSVAEREGRVAGCLRLSSDRDIPLGTKAFWLRPDLKDAYYTGPHTYIYGIGVLPDAKHHGLATEMLQLAEQRARAERALWLFSEIVTSPLTNTASMLFHEKSGFIRIALVEPHESYGLNGFQSLLYGKQMT